MNREEAEKELIEYANKGMLEKLSENRHKPCWRELTMLEMLKNLMIETEELYDEMVFYCDIDVSKEEKRSKIRREAADVANYAAMIIEKCYKMEDII